MPFTPFDEVEGGITPVEDAKNVRRVFNPETDDPGLEPLYPEGTISRIPDVVKGIINVAGWPLRGAAATPLAAATAPFMRPESAITGERPSFADAFEQAHAEHTESAHIPYTGPKDIPTAWLNRIFDYRAGRPTVTDPNDPEKIAIGELPEYAIGKAFSSAGKDFKRSAETTLEKTDSPALATAAETILNAAAFGMPGAKTRAAPGRAGTGTEVSTYVAPREPKPGPTDIEQWLARKAEERAGPISDVTEVGGVEPGKQLVPARDRAAEVESFLDSMKDLRARAEEAGRVRYEPPKNTERVPFEVTPQMAARERAQVEEVHGMDLREIKNPIAEDIPAEQKVVALSALTRENQPAVQGALRSIDEEFGSQSTDNVKTPSSILRKAIRPSIRETKPWFDVQHVRDSYRFKTIATDMENLPDMIGRFVEKTGAQIVKIDTGKVLSPKEWGFRAPIFDLRMPNGQLVEWYMPPKEIEAVKDDAHRRYEKWRGVEEIGKLPRAQRQLMKHDMARSRELFNGAWSAYLKRTGQDESAVRAALDRLSASFPVTGEKYRASESPESGGIRSGGTQEELSLNAMKPSSPITRTRPSSAEETRSGSIEGIIPQEGEVRRLGAQASELVRRDSKGRIIGGFGSRHLASVNAALRRMEKLAREGEVGKSWYKDSAEAIIESVGGNKIAADRIAQVLAITSAGTEIKANFTMAAKALEQYARGEPIHVATKQKDLALENLLRKGIVPESVKVDDFYKNLAQHITGEMTERAVTDRWQFRIASGNKSKQSGTAQQYEYATMLAAETARRLGWRPDEAQAAMWVAMKAQSKLDAMRTSARESKDSKFKGMSKEEMKRVALQSAKTSFASEIQVRGWKPPEGIKFPPLDELRRLGLGDDTMAKDMLEQILFMNDRAKELGYPGLDDLYRNEPAEFNRLAEQWRDEHEMESAATRKRSGIDKVQTSMDEPVGELGATLARKFEAPHTDIYLERYQRPLIAKERPVIAAAIGDLVAAGMPEHFVKATSGYTASAYNLSPALRTDASFDTVNRVISILDILDADPKELRGWLAHETAHTLDLPDGLKPGPGGGARSSDFITARSPRMGVKFELDIQGNMVLGSKPLGTGDISAEITGKWAGAHISGKYSPIAELFDYPLSADHPGTWWYQVEMFAQMHRLFLTNPKLMQKELPIAYSAMKEIYDNAGTSLEETRDAIRKTLRSPGAAAGHPKGRGGEPEQGELREAAQRGDRERDSGERVVGVQAPAEHGGRARVDQTETPEFKRWFGDSKVVDAEGKPLVVYHGTAGQHTVFDVANLGQHFDHPVSKTGFFFVPEKNVAEEFSRYAVEDSNQPDSRARVVSAYLSLQNPVTIQGREYAKSRIGSEHMADAINAAKERGHDGAIIYGWKDGSGASVQYIAFRPEQIKSAIGNRGTFDPNEASILGVGGGGKKPPGAGVTTQGQGPNPYWDVSQPQLVDNLQRAWQNNQIDLKKTQEAIERAAGTTQEKGDAYLAEELYRDRVTSRVKRDYKNQVEPILKDIKDAGLTVDQTSRYLWARHAPERNKAMEKINPGETDLSGLSNQEAAQILASYSPKERAALDGIGEKIDALTAQTRQILVREGLEDKAAINAWEATYKHYVPLFRDIDETGTGSGFQVRGPESKRATGSHREAQAVLAATIAQHERAIVRAEKAKVGRTLIRLAEEHPNPDFWRVDQPPLKTTVNPTTGLVQRGIDPMYRQRDDVFIVKEKDASGKVVERVLSFNPKNERAMEIAKAMKNLDVVQLSAVTKAVGKVTRILANLATSWNPAFWTTNFARDVQTAAINLQSTPLKGRAPQVIANIPRAIGGILSAEFKDGTGKWATHYREFEAAGGKMEWGTIFNDLLDRQKQLASDIKASQRGNINPVKWGTKALEIIEKTNSAIENATRLAAFVEAKEMGLSPAKAASLAKNMTVNFRRKGTQSTGVGAWYMFFNANVQGTARLISAIAKSPRAQAYVGAMVAFAAALELINRMIGEMDSDEDGNNVYELLGEDFLQKNMVFMVPGSKGNHVSIPLPYGFSVFHNAGRMMMETVLAASDSKLVSEKKKPGARAWNFAKVLIDSFMPLGQTTTAAQFIAPSIIDPAVQYAENKNWAGYPIRPEPQSFGAARPAHKEYFRNTSDTAKDLTKWLSDTTGGDEVRGGAIDISPTTITHILGTAGGGAGKFGMGMFDFTKHMVNRLAGEETAEDMSWRGVPFVGKFYGEVEDRDKAAKFYRLRTQAMEVWKQMETYRKTREYDKAQQVEEENPALAAMARELVSKGFKKEMREAREEFKQIDERPRSERERDRRNLRAEETAIMSRALRVFNEANLE